MYNNIMEDILLLLDSTIIIHVQDHNSITLVFGPHENFNIRGTDLYINFEDNVRLGSFCGSYDIKINKITQIDHRINIYSYDKLVIYISFTDIIEITYEDKNGKKCL
jgi:hypothetical protein